MLTQGGAKSGPEKQSTDDQALQWGGGTVWKRPDEVVGVGVGWLTPAHDISLSSIHPPLSAVRAAPYARLPHKATPAAESPTQLWGSAERPPAAQSCAHSQKPCNTHKQKHTHTHSQWPGRAPIDATSALPQAALPIDSTDSRRTCCAVGGRQGMRALESRPPTSWPMPSLLRRSRSCAAMHAAKHASCQAGG